RRLHEGVFHNRRAVLADDSGAARRAEEVLVTGASALLCEAKKGSPLGLPFSLMPDLPRLRRCRQRQPLRARPGAESPPRTAFSTRQPMRADLRPLREAQ